MKTKTRPSEQFGNFLRKEIKRVGLTQIKFSIKAGIGFSTLTAYIAGKHAPMEVKHWKALCNTFGWSNKQADENWDKLMKEIS